jgi:hypothetical protein
MDVVLEDGGLVDGGEVASGKDIQQRSLSACSISSVGQLSARAQFQLRSQIGTRSAPRIYGCCALRQF